jgi:hypothetical protein
VLIRRLSSGPDVARGPRPAYQLCQDFIPDELVDLVQTIEINERKPGLADAKCHLDTEMWFEISLHIHTGGHLGEYVAAFASLGRAGGLNDSRDGRHPDLIRHQMQTHVLEAIIQSGKDGERVTIRALPSVIRLHTVDHRSYWVGDVLKATVVDGDTLSPGLLCPDGEALASDLLANTNDARTHKMIQDGAKVVDSLISQQEDRSWSVNELKAVEVVRTFSI